MHAFNHQGQNDTFKLFEMSVHIQYRKQGFSVSAPKESGDRAAIWKQPWDPYVHNAAGDNANVSPVQPSSIGWKGGGKKIAKRCKEMIERLLRK